jgi:hypothetical protein
LLIYVDAILDAEATSQLCRLAPILEVAAQRPPAAH